MGYERHSGFERRDELRAARLGEVDFVEMARALKALAQEHGIPTGPVMDCLADKGLEQTLAMLNNQSGTNIANGYYRHRAISSQR